MTKCLKIKKPAIQNSSREQEKPVKKCKLKIMKTMNQSY